MKIGTVVLVRFPFTHIATSKKRPALVLRHTHLSSRVHIVTVAMITSKVDGVKIDGDVMLKDWQLAKLLHPSLVRLAKIATIESTIIDKTFGTLSQDDLRMVKKEFAKFFSAWC